MGDKEQKFQLEDGTPVLHIIDRQLDTSQALVQEGGRFQELIDQQTRAKEERWIDWRWRRTLLQVKKSKKPDMTPAEKLRHDRWREDEQREQDCVFRIGGNKEWASWEEQWD